MPNGFGVTSILANAPDEQEVWAVYKNSSGASRKSLRSCL